MDFSMQTPTVKPHPRKTWAFHPLGWSESTGASNRASSDCIGQESNLRHNWSFMYHIGINCQPSCVPALSYRFRAASLTPPIQDDLCLSTDQYVIDVT
jgi:hypothetical protein